MFVKSSGSKVGFSALELEWIARGYADAQKLQFQFEGTEQVIWIRTDGSPIIADVYFMAALGKPSLHIERVQVLDNYKIALHLDARV